MSSQLEWKVFQKCQNLHVADREFFPAALDLWSCEFSVSYDRDALPCYDEKEAPRLPDPDIFSDVEHSRR